MMYSFLFVKLPTSKYSKPISTSTCCSFNNAFAIIQQYSVPASTCYYLSVRIADFYSYFYLCIYFTQVVGNTNFHTSVFHFLTFPHLKMIEYLESNYNQT